MSVKLTGTPRVSTPSTLAVGTEIVNAEWVLGTLEAAATGGITITTDGGGTGLTSITSPDGSIVIGGSLGAPTLEVAATALGKTVRRGYAIQGFSYTVVPANSSRTSVSFTNNEPAGGANQWICEGPVATLPFTLAAGHSYPAGTAVATLYITPNATPTLNPTLGTPCLIPAGTRYSMGNGDILTVPQDVVAGDVQIAITQTASVGCYWQSSTTVQFLFINPSLPPGGSRAVPPGTIIPSLIGVGQTITISGSSYGNYDGTWTVTSTGPSNTDAVYANCTALSGPTVPGSNPGVKTATMTWNPTPSTGGWANYTLPSGQSGIAPTDSFMVAPGQTLALNATPWTTVGTSYTPSPYTGVITAIADSCTYLGYLAGFTSSLPAGELGNQGIYNPIVAFPIAGDLGAGTDMTEANLMSWESGLTGATPRIWSFTVSGIPYADALDFEPPVTGYITAPEAPFLAADRAQLGGTPILFVAYGTSGGNDPASVETAMNLYSDGPSALYWLGNDAAATDAYGVKNISAINVGTGVITSASHGFTNDHTIALYNIDGVTGITGIWWVTNATTNTFTVSASKGGATATFSGSYSNASNGSIILIPNADNDSAFSSGTFYNIGDRVTYSGGEYYCILAGTLSTAPPSDPTHWEVAFSPFGAAGVLRSAPGYIAQTFYLGSVGFIINQSSEMTVVESSAPSHINSGLGTSVTSLQVTGSGGLSVLAGPSSFLGATFAGALWLSSGSLTLGSGVSTVNQTVYGQINTDTLAVSGASSFNSNMTVAGAFWVSSGSLTLGSMATTVNATVNGQVNTDTLAVSGASSFSSNVTVAGAFWVSSGSVTFGSVSSTVSQTTWGSIYATGILQTDGGHLVSDGSGNLTVNSLTAGSGGISVTGALTVAGAFWVSSGSVTFGSMSSTVSQTTWGSIYATGILQTDGGHVVTNGAGQLTVSNLVVGATGAAITGATTIQGGTFTVGTTSSQYSTTLNGTLTVGATTASATTTMYGGLALTDYGVASSGAAVTITTSQNITTGVGLHMPDSKLTTGNVFFATSSTLTSGIFLALQHATTFTGKYLICQENAGSNDMFHINYDGSFMGAASQFVVNGSGEITTLGNNTVTLYGTYGAGTLAAMSAGWGTYSPTITNLTIGNGSVHARYVEIAQTVFFTITVTWGSTTSSAGLLTFNLPTNCANNSGDNFCCTVSGLRSGVTNYTGVGKLVQNTSAFNVISHANANGWSNTNPATWASGDVWVLSGFYESV